MLEVYIISLVICILGSLIAYGMSGENPISVLWMGANWLLCSFRF